jgi:ankyrin repeat protein
VTVWDPEDITPEDINRFILSSSKGLAEPTKSKTPTVHFIHESVRDFLLKENGSAVLQLDVDCTSSGPAHDLLKRNCQRYFVSIPKNQSSRNFKETAMMFPFLDYSVRYVLKHAELAASLGSPQETFLENFPLEEWASLHDLAEKHRVRRFGPGTSLLYILTEMNLLHLFRVEVSRSQSISAKGGRYDYPVIAAAVVGNKQMLELLLEHGADPDKKGREYKNALFAAVDKSNALAVDVLINNGVVSSWTAVAKKDLFVKAVDKKSLLTIKLLLRDSGLQAAAKLLTREEFERFIWLVIMDHEDEILKVLIESEIISHANCDRFRLTLATASRLREVALVHRFLDQHDPYYAGDDVVFSGQPLLDAISYNHETIVRVLLDNGAGVNTAWEDCTGLRLACIRGHEAIVLILLENGADINAVNKFSRTALHEACSQNSEAIVRTLLDNGANINAVDNTGRTALHEACSRNSEVIVRTLLDNGANINAVNKFSRTALHEACSQNSKAIVRMLLDSGADVDQGPLLFIPLTGLWPSAYAQTEIVSTLLEYGANPNQYSLNRRLPLHEALVQGMTIIVKLLLDHSADVNIPSSEYENAYAASRCCRYPAERTACGALLLERRAMHPIVIDLT